MSPNNVTRSDLIRDQLPANGVLNIDPTLLARLRVRKDSSGNPSPFLHATFGPQGPNKPGTTYLTVGDNTQWQEKQSLNIQFIGESTEPAVNAVKAAAAEWSRYQAIQLSFDSSQPADIRIGFEEGSSSYSAVGTEATKVPANEPTMVLGILGNVSPSVMKRETLHEFGHALGLGHEHQSPNANIRWDKPKAYVYYNQLYGWTPEQVDAEVLTPFTFTSYGSTSYDESSIMLYMIPAEITLDGHSHGYNLDLSDLDRCCIGRWYPSANAPKCNQDCN